MATEGGDVQFKFGGDSRELVTALAAVGKQLDKLVASTQGATNDLNKGMSAAIDKLGDKLGKAGGGTKKAGDGAVKMGASFALATAAINVAADAFSRFAGAGIDLVKGAVNTGAQFEMLETRLGTLMGSADAGRERMEELFRISSTTPFELESVVEADVNLRALGADAEKTLPMVLDFAGAMGTDLASAAVEVGRAMQFGAGAVETIAGRALRAQVELRTGTNALKMSTSEFREELIKTLTDKEGIFAGGSAKLATTFAGLTSNLEDNVTAFQKKIADAGLFDATKLTLVETLDLLNDNSEATTEWAQLISDTAVEALFVTLRVIGGIHDGTLAVVAGWHRMIGAVRSVQSSVAGLAESILSVARMGDWIDLWEAPLSSAEENVRLIKEGLAIASKESEETADWLVEQGGLYSQIDDRIGKVRAKLAEGTKETKKGAAELRTAADNAEELKKKTTEAAKAAKALAEVQTELGDIARTAAEDTLDAESKIIAKRKEDLDAIDKLIAAEGMAALTEAEAKTARDAVIARSERDVLALRKSAIEEVRAAAIAAGEDELDLGDAIIAKRNEEIAKLGELAKAHGASAAVIQEVELAQIAVRERAERDLHDLAMEQLEEEKAKRAEVLAAVISGVDSTLGSIESLTGTLSETMAEQGKKGALALFVVSKAAAASQVVLSGVVAIAKAFELGPVAGAVASVAVAAEFAALSAQIAAAEPPSFPMGRPGPGMPPDHELVGVRRDEGILTAGARSRLGDERIRDMNAGRDSGGGTTIVPVPVFRQARRFFRDEARALSPLRRELRRDRRAGQTGF